MDSFPEDWQIALQPILKSSRYASLESAVANERLQGPVFPPPGEVFTAFCVTPLASTKVVILGQDPYHGEGQAHGLCFSVKSNLPHPPSLRNIFKELVADVGCPQPVHGDLTAWARQGVLLLNSILTVRAGQPLSHTHLGWDWFTDEVLAMLATRCPGLVLVAWGSPAQKKASKVRLSQGLVLQAPHPSPLSAYRGFFGSRPFSQINQRLMQVGERPIEWALNNVEWAGPSRAKV